MKTGSKGLTVLFVDDDADEFYLFNEALEQTNLSVSMMRAKDGRQLIHLLSTETHPDIIFMDLNMPYKDGIETLAELKGNPTLQQIPVIIFSTLGNMNQINKCYDNGAFYYVVKPEKFDDITKVVQKVFSFDWKGGHQQPARDEFVLEF